METSSETNVVHHFVVACNCVVDIMQFFLYRKGLSACMCPSNPTLPSIERSRDETNEELVLQGQSFSGGTTVH